MRTVAVGVGVASGVHGCAVPLQRPHVDGQRSATKECELQCELTQPQGVFSRPFNVMPLGFQSSGAEQLESIGAPSVGAGVGVAV